MQQSTGLSCSCIGVFFNPQQKLFLSRKKENDEMQASSSRRSNKSTEIKNESNAKYQKKSLKKRTLSNVSVQTPPSPHLYSQQLESDLKISSNQQDSTNRQDYSFSRTLQSPKTQAKILFNYGGSLRNIEEVWKQKSYNKFWQQKNHRPKTPVILPQTFCNNFVQTPPMRNKQADFKDIQYIERQNLQFYGNPQNYPYSMNEIPHKQDQKHIQKIHYLSKDTQKQAESWMGMKEEEELIEEFDHFFRNKQEHQSIANLSQPNKSLIRQRQQNIFKRPQKPQLIGRFAESDDESRSSSPPSEVIGKGFNSNLYDFWENQQSNNAKQTSASRSTNTKFSELNKGESEEQVRPKFGTVASFKSYKYL